MTTDWKEFTADWISTLEIEKRLPCRPAGRPMRIISFALFQSTRHSLISRRMTPWVRMRQASTSAMLMTWLTTVAMATPATSIWNRMTRSIFSSTFTSPASIR